MGSELDYTFGYRQDLRKPLWYDPDPPTYEWTHQDRGFIVTKSGVGQTTFSVTGCGMVLGTPYEATVDRIGIPEGPSATPTPIQPRSLSEAMEDTITAGGMMSPPHDSVDDGTVLKFGVRPEDITSPADAAGIMPETDFRGMVERLPLTLVDLKAMVVTDALDFGVPGLKNLYAVTVVTDLQCKIYVGVYPRFSMNEKFRDPVIGHCDHTRPTAGFNIGAIDFRLMAFVTGFDPGTITEFICHYKIIDYRNLHGYLRPATEAHVAG